MHVQANRASAPTGPARNAHHDHQSGAHCARMATAIEAPPSVGTAANGAKGRASLARSHSAAAGRLLRRSGLETLREAQARRVDRQMPAPCHRLGTPDQAGRRAVEKKSCAPGSLALLKSRMPGSSRHLRLAGPPADRSTCRTLNCGLPRSGGPLGYCAPCLAIYDAVLELHRRRLAAIAARIEVSYADLFDGLAPARRAMLLENLAAHAENDTAGAFCLWDGIADFLAELAERGGEPR